MGHKIEALVIERCLADGNTGNADKYWRECVDASFSGMLDRLQDAERERDRIRDLWDTAEKREKVELVADRDSWIQQTEDARDLALKLGAEKEAAETLAEEREQVLAEADIQRIKKGLNCYFCISFTGHLEDCRLAKALNPPQVGTKGE